MHTVFISYSTKDTQQAETVRNVLEQNEIPCWMAPRDIPGGSNYTREIPVAIRGCQVFVLILSTNSQKSPWVLKELDAAVNAGKVILPFMLEECQLSDEFNFLLTGAQRYAAYQKKAGALEALVSRVQALTSGAPVGKAEEPAPVPAAKPEPKAPAKKVETILSAAHCPACSGSELEYLEKKIGHYTAGEKALALLTPAIAVVIAVVFALALTLLITCIPGASEYAFWMLVVLFLVGLVLGWVVCKNFLQERIRRNRVRRQVYPHPFCCAACKKEFLLDKTKVTL